MKPIKILIVDDEPLAHKILENYAKQLDYINIVGSCYDGISAVNFLNNHSVEAILLDIQMPDLTGMELLESIKPSSVKIIFTTAYTEYALESFNYENVIDYLHKPIRIARFIKSMERLKTQLSLENAYNEMPVDKDNSKKNHRGFLVMKDNKIYHKINLEDICYLESYGNYVKIYEDNAKFKMFRSTLKDMEFQLPEDIFLRVHKTYIINLDKVKALQGNLIILDTKKIPVGKSYTVAVKKKII